MTTTESKSSPKKRSVRSASIISNGTSKKTAAAETTGTGEQEVSRSRVDFNFDFMSSAADPYNDRMSRSALVPSELHDYELTDQINFLPIVYSPSYDVCLFGIEKVHPMDTKKWSKIAASVKEFLLTSGGSRYDVRFLEPKRCITRRELSLVHSPSFVRRMHHNKRTIASAAESFFLLLIPMPIIRSRLIKPLKWQVSGSILASKVALDQVRSFASCLSPV